MRRFSPLLRHSLKRSLQSGELSAQQSEAVGKLLSARGKEKREAWRQLLAECAGVKGFATAVYLAADGDSETPILDWIKRNWSTILSIVIAIVMQFLL